MRPSHHKSVAYEIITEEEQPKHVVQDRCFQRLDDVGLLNGVRAWYLFVLHIAACVGLILVLVKLVDGKEFKTGSPPTIFHVGSALYQTQISGLLSGALVLLRMLVGACTILLTWRIIFVVLEKEGLTLPELVRLVNSRIPFLHLTSWRHFLWSVSVAVVTILMWSPSFAAPLANSSIAWIPAMKIVRDTTAFPVSAIDPNNTDWNSLMYLDVRFRDTLTAAQMTGKDPTYAFESLNMPFRRYFTLYQNVTDESIVDLAVPYFDVKVDWIDAANDNRTYLIGNASYTDVTDSQVAIRVNGSTQMIADSPLVFSSPTPAGESTFFGKRLIAVKVATWGPTDQADDGSLINENSTCPGHSLTFGQLPNVSQTSISYWWSRPVDPFAAIDCFLLAEASIVAGQYPGQDCVTNSAGPDSYTATCMGDSNVESLQPDWLTPIVLDFMSEVMKYSVMLNYTEPWAKPGNLDSYVTGLLTLSYHAAWSALMEHLGKSGEADASARLAESVVRAVVNRTRLYAWLAMNVTLTTSALLVCLMQMTAGTVKTIRDPTLAALTVDLTSLSHSRQARGLCTAVELSESDQKLPRIRWKNQQRRGRRSSGVEMLQEGACARAVTFVNTEEIAEQYTPPPPPPEVRSEGDSFRWNRRSHPFDRL